MHVTRVRALPNKDPPSMALLTQIGDLWTNSTKDKA